MNSQRQAHQSGGYERTAALLARHWMRAEELVSIYYPGEITVLAATRGLPWGTDITGKWLVEESAMKGTMWPSSEEVSRVSQVLLMFTNAIESIALGTDPDTLLKLVGGSMIDQMGLVTLLQYMGRAFRVTSSSQLSDDVQDVTGGPIAWASALGMSDRCKSRFLRNTGYNEVVKTRGRHLAKAIESAKETLYFTDLVRNEINAGFEEEEARLIVMEGITLSRAVVTGEQGTASYLNSVQAARRTVSGLAGSVLVDDWVGGRRLAEFSPWAAALCDGTICNIAPDGSWACQWQFQVCVLGNLRTIFIPVTDLQREELNACAKGRWWPSELREICQLDLNTLTSLGRLSSAIPDVMKDVEKQFQEAYSLGCNGFGEKSVKAADEALQLIRDRHPTAWDVFISRNVTRRTLIGAYEDCSRPSEFVSAMTQRLVVGLSGCTLRIVSDTGERSAVIRATGIPRERGITFMGEGLGPGIQLSLLDLAESLGTKVDQRRWVYAGLKMIATRFDDVAKGNCVAALLHDAEYTRYIHLMPSFATASVPSLSDSVICRYDQGRLHKSKREAIGPGPSWNDEDAADESDEQNPYPRSTGREI